MPFDLDLFRQDVLTDPIVYATWHDKYRWKEADGITREQSVAETRERVVRAVYAKDPSQEAFSEALELVQKGYLVPAGRVNAGAGLDRAVTLTNCFVNEIIQDSMVGIQRGITNAALTMQQGGGIGTDFSSIRPNGALVKRTGSVSSGVIPFMDQMSSMSDTVISAGTRRGAMMATLRCDHPDLWNPEQFETVTKFDGSVMMKNPSFISAKRQRGRLTQFNVSILVTEAFMEAIKQDAYWDLGFHVPRADGLHVDVYDKPFPYDVIERDNQGNKLEGDWLKKGVTAPWYVYTRVKARDLWNDVMRSTYVYAEPGVIFIDRVNERNNLRYCEEINCTNPCFGAGTLIVTDKGPRRIEDLIGKTVNVWDGETWQSIDNFRVTGHDQPMLKISMQDGSDLRVTLNHEFILSDNSRRRACELTYRDRLKVHEVNHHGTVATTGAYIKGFLLGDGSHKRNAQPQFQLHPPKYGCAGRLVESALSIKRGTVNTNALVEVGFSEQNNGIQDRMVMTGLTPLKDDLIDWCTTFKTRLPSEIYEWNRQSKADFIAGLFDADGTAQDGAKGYGYQLSSIHRSLLKDVQTLLKSMGVNTKLSLCKSPGQGGYKSDNTLWRLVISQNASVALSQQVTFSRLPSFANKILKYNLRSKIGDVDKIEEDGTDERVYCCTVEGSRSIALSIGVLSGQCGEQPLPEHGTCCLSSINLAFMVKKPFTDEAYFDFDLYRRTIRQGVRFLDNVLTVTKFPLQAQQDESDSKRRIGLGVTGLADAFVQLKIVYGSNLSVALSQEFSSVLQEESYSASADLAAERGAFPLCDITQLGSSFNVSKLPDYVITKINHYGLRNGVLNTVAPNGTISLYTGNVPSGIEPIFSIMVAIRKMRQPDGSYKEFEIVDYGLRMFREMFPGQPIPNYFVGAHDVHPRDHVRVLAAWQEHIDAAISKTINCPESLPFEEFSALYQQAYDLGCKGCTTYRPDPISGRGSVLTEIAPIGPSPSVSAAADELIKTMVGMKTIAADLRHDFIRPRPDVVPGRTYKVKWPQSGENIYVTITNDGKNPLEVFIKHADALLTEWTDGLSRMVTGVLRRGGDVKFIVEQLKQVGSSKGGAFMKGSFHASQVAAVAWAIDEEFKLLGVYDQEARGVSEELLTAVSIAENEEIGRPIGTVCPVCQLSTLIHEVGCKRCLTCGHEECG